METIDKTKNKIIVFAFVFGAVLLADFLRHYYTGKEGLVSWILSIHAVWPVFSLFMMIAVIIFYGENKFIIYIPAAIHFAVAFLGYLNVYLNFSSIINYDCLLFNLILFVLYYMAI